VTDAKGHFLITARDPFQAISVTVTARAFADRNFNDLPASAASRDFMLTEGAALTGRVMSGAKPLGGARVGVSGANRRAGVWAGHFEIATTEEGRFTLVNLPPDIDYYLYGLLDPARPHDATAAHEIHAGADGTVTDAGDLMVTPGYRVAGRVVLSDGRPLPMNTRLLLVRQNAWDSAESTLDHDGRFEFDGIPAEPIQLGVRVPGYRISTRNAGLNSTGIAIVGKVDRDIENLVFLLDPGEVRLDKIAIKPLKAGENPADRPLHGAEDTLAATADPTVRR
jgi:hypothetical protein